MQSVLSLILGGGLSKPPLRLEVAALEPERVLPALNFLGIVGLGELSHGSFGTEISEWLV